MLQVLLWALGTGFVTGAVWFAIVIYRRPQLPARETPVPVEPPQAQSLTPEDMTRRLLELEERLDATEHLLKRQQVDQPRKLRP